MANRTINQLYHYILSFNDDTLIKWFNGVVTDPFGDFSEQIIRENTEIARERTLTTYDMENTIAMLRNTKTNYCEDDKYIAILGGVNPFVISFNTFEEFLEKGEKAMILYVADEPVLLTQLEEMANE